MKQVKLIAITPDAGKIIAFCARGSNPENQNNHATAPRLLRYLARNKHWSPFEMAHAVMEINTTRDIARQILRHRSFSFQEFSGRYAEMPRDAIYREARLQDTKNRQNSLENDDASLDEAWMIAQRSIAEHSRRIYDAALKTGIAKEVARAVLPEGLTQSRIYMAGNIRSWMHYIEVRTDPTTQKEHREIAAECAKVLADSIPEIKEFLTCT